MCTINIVTICIERIYIYILMFDKCSMLHGNNSWSVKPRSRPWGWWRREDFAARTWTAALLGKVGWWMVDPLVMGILCAFFSSENRDFMGIDLQNWWDLVVFYEQQWWNNSDFQWFFQAKLMISCDLIGFAIRQFHILGYGWDGPFSFRF